MQKEAKARIKINNLLQSSGWRFFDDEKGTANIALENNVKLTKNAVDELGNDFDKTNIERLCVSASLFFPVQRVFVFWFCF